jgi:diguanylate cyclase (GGDEF)-like protein/PAS domain S-box-containing protein
MRNETICGLASSIYLEDFFDSMGEAFAIYQLIYDEENNPINYEFLEVNNTFASITGFKKEFIIGKSIAEIMPSLEQCCVSAFKNASIESTSISFHNYNANLDKHFKVSAFSSAKDQFITVFSDITELKKAAEIMKKHQLLFDNAQDIIFYATIDGSIIDANVSAIDKYGYPIDQLTKLNVQDLRHTSTNALFLGQMKEADKNGITFETIHMKKDGTCFPVEVSAKSVLIDDYRLRIHIVRDISERKMAEEKITYLANYDSLTRIPNRSHLMNHLKLTMENARRGNFKFALMLFDIDKFKKINDVYGHESGDIALIETARVVQNTIRTVDFIGRLGGDEFVIIQPYVSNNEDCSLLANRILEQFKTKIKLNKAELNISISIGISIYPDDSTDSDCLMNFSDKAMYSTKQNGGNAFEFYSNIK